MGRSVRFPSLKGPFSLANYPLQELHSTLKGFDERGETGLQPEDLTGLL